MKTKLRSSFFLQNRRKRRRKKNNLIYNRTGHYARAVVVARCAEDGARGGEGGRGIGALRPSGIARGSLSCRLETGPDNFFCLPEASKHSSATLIERTDRHCEA